MDNATLTTLKLSRLADLRERMHGNLTVRHVGPQGTDVHVAVVVVTAQELEFLIDEAERGIKLT